MCLLLYFRLSTALCSLRPDRVQGIALCLMHLQSNQCKLCNPQTFLRTVCRLEARPGPGVRSRLASKCRHPSNGFCLSSPLRSALPKMLCLCMMGAFPRSAPAEPVFLTKQTSHNQKSNECGPTT